MKTIQPLAVLCLVISCLVVAPDTLWAGKDKGKNKKKTVATTPEEIDLYNGIQKDLRDAVQKLTLCRTNDRKLDPKARMPKEERDKLFAEAKEGIEGAASSFSLSSEKLTPQHVKQLREDIKDAKEVLKAAADYIGDGEDTLLDKAKQDRLGEDSKKKKKEGGKKEGDKGGKE